MSRTPLVLALSWIAVFGSCGGCALLTTVDCWQREAAQRTGDACSVDHDCDGVCDDGVCARDPSFCDATLFTFLPGLMGLAVAGVGVVGAIALVVQGRRQRAR